MEIAFEIKKCYFDHHLNKFQNNGSGNPSQTSFGDSFDSHVY